MKTERAIAEFIDYKQSLGRRYSCRSIILRAFARVAGGSDIRKVTPDIVRKFIDGRGPVTNAWFARFSTLNCLFRYALSRNYIAASPLPKLKPRRPVDFRPYIYSAADVGCRGITASAQLAIGATNDAGIASPAVRSWPENQ